MKNYLIRNLFNKMRILIYTTVFLTLILVGCAGTASKQKMLINMDSSKNKNPVFSKTDTAKVEINNE